MHSELFSIHALIQTQHTLFCQKNRWHFVEVYLEKCCFAFMAQNPEKRSDHSNARVLGFELGLPKMILSQLRSNLTRFDLNHAHGP